MGYRFSGDRGCWPTKFWIDDKSKRLPRRLRFRPQPTQFAIGVVDLGIRLPSAMQRPMLMAIKSKELMGGAVAAEVAEPEAAEEGKAAAVVVVAVAVDVNLAIPITAL